MRAPESGDITIIRHRVLGTGPQYKPYSAAVQRYGWQGYYYVIDTITNKYAQHFSGGSQLEQEIVKDAEILVELMENEDPAVATLAQVAAQADMIVEKLESWQSPFTNNIK